MMLSRVAERIYWAARYLQRVESSSRVVNVYTNLLMDLPKGVNISWFNLVTLNSSQEEYEMRYKVRDERNVVKFTLADENNSSSMFSSLSMVRENFRTTRDVVPEIAWELINELNSFTQESIKGGALNRAKRHEFLAQVLNQCQMIQGYVASSMSHDATWDLWRLGRALERIDMTTRILEAGATVLLDDTTQKQAHLIVWGNVLRSSNASHAYRRAVSATIKGKKVINFLLFDDEFPRSIVYCLAEIKKSIRNLPRGKKVLFELKELEKLMATIDDKQLIGENLIDCINQLQLALDRLHGQISDVWFSLD